MKNIKQKFKVYCSTDINKKVTKEYVDSLVQEDKPLILEAIASTNSVDLEGDYMTNDCLEDMKKQAVGLSIFLDHNHTIDKIVGTVTEVIETSSDVFKIKFSVLPKYEWYITDLLENGVNLGLSIGASVLDYDNTDEGWKINKVKLVEISIVAIPANWDTFGTVQTSKELGEVTAKCFNGACKQIIDSLDLSKDLVDTDKELEDGEDPEEDGILTEEEVVKLINEACIELKNQIITEIVSEYNLDGKKHQTNDSEQNNDDSSKNESTNSSNDNSEDKEKNLEMEKEEIVELIKENTLTSDMVKELILEALKEKEAEVEVTEGTPIVKEEEVETTKAKEDEKDDEDENSEEEEEDKDKKSKSLDETVVDTPQVDVDELKKELIKDLTPKIRKELETEILKELSVERKPEAKPQPKVEDLEKSPEQKKEEPADNVMSSRDIAKKMLGF